MPDNKHTVTVLTSTANFNSNVVVSEPVRYDSFWAHQAGVGTFQVVYDNFTGSVSLQASLSENPGDQDFFDIQPIDPLLNYTSDGSVTSLLSSDWQSQGQRVASQPLHVSESYTIRGNYTYVRVVVNISGGQIQRILLSN